MKYAVVSVNNGNFKVESEHGTNKQAAFVKFHDLCKIYWNASDVITCMIKVVDENLDVVEDKMELIVHELAGTESIEKVAEKPTEESKETPAEESKETPAEESAK